MRSLQLEFDKHPIRVPIEADLPAIPDVSKPIVLEGHVFISYAREDGSHVDRLQRRLETAGILALLGRHWRTLHELGFVTDDKPLAFRGGRPRWEFPHFEAASLPG
jgi:hypothetical protein